MGISNRCERVRNNRRLFLRHPSALCFTLLAALAPSTVSATFRDVSQDAGFVQNDHLLVGTHFLPPMLYENLGSGEFAPVEPSPFDAADHHGMVIADFDDDGDLDIYLTGGASGGTGQGVKSLYRNDGDFVFRNIAVESGLGDGLARGRSCSAMDVNGDGALDLFVAKARRTSSANSLFLNDGNGHFTDIAAAAGIADPFGSVGGVWGDYDRDGDPDLFVSGMEATVSESRLYRNEGDLTFTDVTNDALGGIGQVSAAAWGDYDNDGDLDLVVGLGDEAVFDAVRWQDNELQFFFNARADDNGVDSFDFTHEGGESTFDLLFQGQFLANRVFIGGDRSHPESTPFTLPLADIGQPAYTPGVSFGFFLWSEVTPDVWKMRCVTPPGIGTNFAGTITTDGALLDVVSTDLERYTSGPRGSRLYRNDGGIFADVTDALGLTDADNVRNVTWVDFDMDGDLDLHVHNKGDTEVQNHPDVIYRNHNGSFQDVTAGSKAAGPTKGLGDGAAFGDFDGDGDPDLAITSGASPRFFALQETHRLYENRTRNARFLRVNLEGVASTRDGYGAWVTCVSGLVGTQTRYVSGDSWGGSQVGIDPVFGLGRDRTVDVLRVEWPSGVVTELTDVSPGTVTVVESGEVIPRRAVEPPFPLQIVVSPNPAPDRVAFEILGRGSVDCTLEIIDTAGRRVMRQAIATASTEPVVWDGTDDRGHRVATGIYYAIVSEGASRAMTKVTLIR